MSDEEHHEGAAYEAAKNDDLITCEICGNSVYSRFMDAHLRNFHGVPA